MADYAALIELNKLRDKTRAVKVCWMLVGLLGVHNFVAGKPLHGLISLILFGLFTYHGAMMIATFFELLLADFQSTMQEDEFIDYLANTAAFFIIMTGFWVSDFFTVIKPLDKACQKEERRLSL